MAPQRKSNAPFVVIVGPTASGKTSLAIRLAQRFNGEVICADSRTIYKEMNIGTAKPTLKEQATVPHWGINIISPDQRFSVAEFKGYATEKIQEIRDRDHIPFLVGGSGLYVDSVLFDYQFGEEPNYEQRAVYERMSLNELQGYCIKNNIKLPKNAKNKRYVIRAIEQRGINKKRRIEPIDNTIIVGITTDKTTLYQRLIDRIEQQFNDGVVDEAIKLGKKYHWQGESFTGNIYQIIKQGLDDRIGEPEVKQRAFILDRKLAKKQRTWFRRNPYIRWLSLEEAEVFLRDKLAMWRKA